MGGWAGYAIQSAASAIVPIVFLKFSRGFEAEADQLGLQYMYKTGYDPTALVDFFERIETQEKTKPGTLSRVFSTVAVGDYLYHGWGNAICQFSNRAAQLAQRALLRSALAGK